MELTFINVLGKQYIFVNIQKKKKSHKIDDLPVCGELLVQYFSDTLQQS